MGTCPALLRQTTPRVLDSLGSGGTAPMRSADSKNSDVMTGCGRRCGVAFVLCILGTTAIAQSDGRRRLESAARNLQELTPSDYLQDRVPAEIAELAELPRREVESAVGHPDPRVRSLALGVLALRGDPQSLPTMLAVAFDRAPGLPAREPHAVALVMPGVGGGPQWTLRPQTVGEIATSFLRVYMEAAGFWYGIEGNGRHPGFADYWRERRDRAHCLSWFRLDLNRASQASFPMAEQRRPKVAAVRRRIDALETPYRDWILLALATPWEASMREPGAEALAPEADLLQAARSLGRERILGLLRGEAVLPDDPDFRYTNQGPLELKRVVPFLLRHAGVLLERESSRELRTIGYRHLAHEPVGDAPSLVTGRWFTAAADLDPGHAVPILLEALERFRGTDSVDWQDHRVTIVTELWRHAGADELPRVLDWFFTENPQRGAFGFGRHRFASSLASRSHAAVLRAILRDERVAGLDWQTVGRLVEAANALAEEPVVPLRELSSVSHPLGEGHYHWEKERARVEYPDATAALEATLARWRTALAAWARRGI